MKRSLTPLLCALLAWQAQAQSDCSSALPVTAGTYVWVDQVNGTQVPTPVCALTGAGATAGMWYRYTAPEHRTVRVTTDLTINAGRDTRVHVYSGDCAALTCVAGDDDSGTGTLAMVQFEATEGNTYLIAFDDRWDAQGFTFQVVEIDPVATPVTFTPGSFGFPGAECVVDMDGDGLDDVVTANTASVLVSYQQWNGSFQTVNCPATITAMHSPSWSLAAGDVDANGRMDLVYGGGGGVSFMIASDDGASFSAVNFSEYVFSQRTNFVDINNDGHLDAFVCHDVAPNVYFMNDGTGALSFNQGMLGPNGGNYGSLWTDYDGDGDVDLFVAKCGSSPPDVLMRNNGDGTFTDVAGPLGFADGHQAWSSAWGDFDNDGHMDVLVGSSASNYHKLMHNNGDGTFTNITPGSGFDTFTGSSIEWKTYDFNNDGFLDIIGGGAMLMNNGDLTFTPYTGLPSYGPVGDLNNDGFLDIVIGGVVQYNDGNANNYLKVIPQGVQSNRNAIGAKVRVFTSAGMQTREIRSGDGFAYMSTLYAYFGLGSATTVDSIRVEWPSGIVDVTTTPAVNTTVTIIEGAHPVAVQELVRPVLTLYPVPATHELVVRMDRPLDGAVAVVYDASGRRVARPVVRAGRMDVSGLSPGSYLLELSVGGQVHRRTFLKQ